ncbi:MAG: Arginine-tRNA ligase, partial [Parcubacteria group bacterium GW2011_GWC1_38_6]
MIKGKLEKIIQESLENLKSHSDHFSGAVFEIEGFSGIDHGDYAVTIRNIIEGGLKRGHDFETTKFTQDDGEVILEEIKKHPDFDKIFDRAEFKFPVFFNFFTNKKVLLDELKQVFKKKQNYGFSSGWKDKKVIVEFTDPNPFKEFHIGHLYSNIVGEAISRFSGAVGARVKRINYQGDVGLHVAKAVWGIEQKIVSEKINFAKLESKPLKERIVFLGQAYVLGANAFEEDNTAKEEIVELNKKIFKLDKTIKNVYQKGRRWSLLYFEKIYKRLGTKFDSYYFESEVAPTGEKLVKDGLKRGIFKESEGAIIFPGENYGLHNRVFINSQGLPTYEAKELGLALAKNKDFKYDLSIIITGNEIVEYFKVLIAALEAVLPDLGVKTLHI